MDAERAQYLAALAATLHWLESESISHVIAGSLACAAHSRLEPDFSRPSPFDLTQRCPDIDVLVPRAVIPHVDRHARSTRPASADDALEMLPIGAANTSKHFLLPAVNKTLAWLNRAAPASRTANAGRVRCLLSQTGPRGQTDSRPRPEGRARRPGSLSGRLRAPRH
jgi:hypothetical protein